jgi:hypothetical protein
VTTETPHKKPIFDTYTDFVRGECIGGDYVQWELVYDGRQQATGYADSDEDAIAQAKQKRDELKRELNPIGLLTGSMWEVRLRP